MKEKSGKKVNVSAFLVIVAMFVIAVMGMCIFKLNNEKNAEIQKSTELQDEVDKLKGEVKGLQGKIDIISKTISTDNSEEVSDKEESSLFTDEQVRTALSDYLMLKSNANCDNLLKVLSKQGKINYDESKDEVQKNGVVITTLKFSDYKNAMLNYVTEGEFEKNWTSALKFEENENGYLTKLQGGGDLREYTVNSVSKIDSTTYSAKTTSVLDDKKEDETFTVKVEAYKNTCIIDSVK